MPPKPLECHACGRPAHLTDHRTTTCGSCGSTMDIPPAYQALRAASANARSARQAAESQIDALLKGALPPRVATIAGMLWVLGALSAPVLFALTGSRSPRAWVVIAGLLPSAILGLVWCEIWLRTRPWVHFVALGGKLRPRMDRNQLGCGSCGAPLEIEPEARAATCDYCLSDSWVLHTSTHDPNTAGERHHNNLRDLLAGMEFRSLERNALLIVWPLTWLTVMAILWLSIPASV